MNYRNAIPFSLKVINSHPSIGIFQNANQLHVELIHDNVGEYGLKNGSPT